MTALEEKLSKTEYIYVLGFDGKPQMPTRRKRHVLKLLKTGRARIAEDIPFTIRLTYRNSPVLQPVTLAEDPGRTNIGAAVLSPLGGLLFAAVIETRNKEIKKLMADRQKSRLDLLMAGLIANTETRLILGKEISQEWFRILKQRDFGYQDALDRDFLSAEAYKKIQKQKEEQKEKERQDREAREVEIRKASLEVKLQGLTIKEAAKVFAGKVPSFVFLDRERTLALLEVYKEHFEDKEIFTDKKVICKLMKFFLDCYENNYITKPVLMNKLGLLKED